jgi:prephenate dehydrogenase
LAKGFSEKREMTVGSMGKFTVGIFGYGRFGQVMGDILKQDFDVYVTNRSDKSAVAREKGVKFVTKEELLEKCDAVFLCVPISEVETALKENKFSEKSIVIDTCSVKEYPVELMIKYLPLDTRIIASHPMFGPDSAKGGLKGLNFVMHNIRCDNDSYGFWFDYFRSKGLNMVDVSPKEHDRLAANSQGIAHLIGRILERMGAEPTPIDTVGFRKLMEVKQMTCNDTMQLFNDLQMKNKFTRQMRSRFYYAVEALSSDLLPAQAHPDHLTIGIQGIEGSYCEQACREICEAMGIRKYAVKYLVKSHNVLDDLFYGNIDKGVMALENSTAGVVMETIEAMSEHPCKIEKIMPILVSHCLIVRPGTKMDGIKAVYSHIQGLMQCKDTLKRVLPEAKQVEQEDTALSAKNLSEGKYPEGSAAIASEAAAKRYGLEILARGMNDLKENYTDFMLIRRK